MPVPILIVLLLAAVIIVPSTTGSFWLTVSALAAVLIANPIVRTIRKNRYPSEHFQTLKAEIASVVAEHNDVVNYVEEIHAQGSFELGSSSTGQHAHLTYLRTTRRGTTDATGTSPSTPRTCITRHCKSSVAPAPTHSST